MQYQSASSFQLRQSTSHNITSHSVSSVPSQTIVWQCSRFNVLCSGVQSDSHIYPTQINKHTHRNTHTNTHTNKQTNERTNKQTTKQASKQAGKQAGKQATSMDENIKAGLPESGGGLSAKTEQAHSTWDLCTFTASTSPDGHAGRFRPQAAKSPSQRRKGVIVASTKVLWGRGLNKSPRIIRLLTQRPTASSVSIVSRLSPTAREAHGAANTLNIILNIEIGYF